jgi:hypothetical protein
MAKITVLEAKTYQGKPSGFKVTLDNGTTGNLQEKESDKGLRVGDEVNVTIIPYTSKAGVQSNLLGLRLVTSAPQTTPTPLPTSQQGKITPPNTSAISATKSFVEMKFEGRVVCIKLAVECILQGKMERPEAKEAFAEWVSVLDASIDELKSK